MSRGRRDIRVVAQHRREHIEKKVAGWKGRVNIQLLMNFFNVWGSDGLTFITSELNWMAGTGKWGITVKEVDAGLQRYEEYNKGPKILKPCPFCGGPAKHYKWSAGAGYNASPSPACTGCRDCRVYMEGSARVAGDNWNQRSRRKVK